MDIMDESGFHKWKDLRPGISFNKPGQAIHAVGGFIATNGFLQGLEYSEGSKIHRHYNLFN
jgi:hypothetical protein